MSVISRRQRDLLLNDVSRMINNNIHSAFANHAKIAECISNGDLKLYIDSPKKEVVLKYGNKEIRFTIADQQINQIASIVFNDKSIIKGISDSCLISSSTIALSTKGANELKSKIDNKADKNHNHDDKYAAKDHNHDSKYADINHTHNEYQPKGNYQPKGSYAAANHTHSEYADKNHTHWDLPNDKDDFEEEIKTIVNGPKWWRVIKGVGKVLGVASDVVQYGCVAGLQAEITALYQAMAANGLMDVAQTTTSLGTCLTGYADTFKKVGSGIQKLGKTFESISEPCKKISTAINKGADVINRYAKIVDDFCDVDGLKDMTELCKQFHKGKDIAKTKLPNTTKMFNKNLYTKIA